MEESYITVKITMSKTGGEGVLVASDIIKQHNLGDAVSTSLQVSGNKLIIYLRHEGEYLSTRQNKAVNGQLVLSGEQLLSNIIINYRLMSNQVLLESITKYFTVENYGDDSFNISFKNSDLGGSKLPEEMYNIDIELLGVAVISSFNLFGNFDNIDTK